MESGSSSGQFSSSPQPPQSAQHPDAIRSNPHLPQVKAPRLTQEEINILEECNTESFWYRCVPLAVAFGGATTYLVKTGHLNPHPRYGATLKTMGAVFLGYVMGKLSYQSICQQKILEKIPHSNLAQSVRKSRGITSIHEESIGEMAPVAGYRTDKMRDTYSSIDTSADTSPRNVKELDDSLRPSLDREVKSPKEAASDPQSMSTYDELRQRNRLEYEKSMATSPSSPFRQRPFPVPRPNAPLSAPPAESAPSQSPQGSRAMWDAPPPASPGRAFDSARGEGGTGQKNEYGDVWDNN